MAKKRNFSGDPDLVVKKKAAEMTPAMEAIKKAKEALHPNAKVPGEFLEAKAKLIKNFGGFGEIIKKRLNVFGDLISRLRRVPQRISNSLGIENIAGVYIGRKNQSAQPSIVVQVLRKTDDKSLISADALLPQSIRVGGMEIPIDVEEILPVFSQAAQPGSFVKSEADLGQHGTFGCLVAIPDGTGNFNPYILSNTHVLAGVNAGVRGSTHILTDGGTIIGKLKDYVDYNFGGSNTIDAAIALTHPQLTTPVPVDSNLLTEEDPTVAVVGEKVKKVGAVSDVTFGEIASTNADIMVTLPNGSTVQFNDVLLIRGANGQPFSLGGDSGSLVIDHPTNQPVGLLFAGSGNLTYATPIEDVVNKFEIHSFIKDFNQ